MARRDGPHLQADMDLWFGSVHGIGSKPFNPACPAQFSFGLMREFHAKRVEYLRGVTAIAAGWPRFAGFSEVSRLALGML